MSSHSAGRKVRNPEEARQLLSRWHQSKKSLADWCRFHGINVHSLAAHKKNLERKPTEKAEAVIDFVEVKLLSPPKASASYQIDLANGHTIRCDDHFDPEQLRHLLHLVAAC